jgi:hypothetical protein
MTDLQVVHPAALLATLLRVLFSRFAVLSLMFRWKNFRLGCENFKSTLNIETLYAQLGQPSKNKRTMTGHVDQTGATDEPSN